MTMNNNFLVEVKLQVFIHLLYFGLSGLDSKVLFMITGAYYENDLYSTVVFMVVVIMFNFIRF